MAKRIFLFLTVNFLVVTVISFFLYIFNIQPFLQKRGLNLPTLAIFCLIWGMGGAFISLLLSKFMAKSMMGIRMIDPNTNDPAAREVLNMVHALSKKAGLPAMPEVGIYNSPEVNAFATGPSKRNSLVAVSSGLLQRMNDAQVEGVLGHEVTHIANGDMVTMTLLQGVVNAFVMFFARIIAYAVTRGDRREESNAGGFAYYGIVFLLEMVFMILGSVVIATFSRRREYRADLGGAKLSSPEKMISALNALKKTVEIKDQSKDQPAFQAFKISNYSGILKFFASHPPLDDRIARLQKRYKTL
ncbi:Protease HtpX-like protein [Chlamydiales bacterium STE3]|nr:Protease HtpX-like protein [Chlamydiales bacterium STE3]